MSTHTPIKLFAAAATLILGSAGLAYGEDWRPTQPVNMIVPSNPGGGHDNNARVLASILSQHAGQPVNIINQPAGGGVVAYNEMRSASPDGLTIGQVSISLVSDVYRIEGVDYDENSFAYIGQISTDQNVLTVSASGPYADMNIIKFIDHAKERPGDIVFGVSGNWTNHDYTRLKFELATDTSFLRVPIKGGSQIVLSLMAGDVGIGALYPSEIKAQVEAGNLKMLAHNGDAPIEEWPEVPSLVDEGIDVDLAIWRALVLPPETSEEIQAGWSAILENTMNDPALKEAYRSAGIGFAYRNSADTKDLISASAQVYRDLSIAAELTPEAVE
ncbi:tripartite tricarboxylate transporter substrate binding protein [Devosia sp. YIM 151766]|uniref:tripartite tricarboxylate transporter substrate binding protein n=1 Tax=Devosia sp. YIM 151766 TaxID=3017325 RepID=UPI00255CCB07|nr:tripartite tricarboxylate transporter substrate binding protein [Devosia sp. YIM 151766]WIY52385.1 tripartite tricarboxylate transporter substrate binding protein [Devosia sp. YIM 151766]